MRRRCILLWLLSLLRLLRLLRICRCLLLRITARHRCCLISRGLLILRLWRLLRITARHRRSTVLLWLLRLIQIY